nr:PadR family transcriptional regulator [Demequina pelophila]
MDRDGALTQLRKGVVEYCVLALLRESSTYGLELTSRLTRDGGLLANEGTLYPVLSRMRRVGTVSTAWHESPSGPPRRYYQITDAGLAALSAFADIWGPFTQQVNQILENSNEAPPEHRPT